MNQYYIKTFRNSHKEDGSIHYQYPYRTYTFRFKLIKSIVYSIAKLYAGLRSHPKPLALYKTKYSVEGRDLGIDYQDIGPWRSYILTTSGDSLEECLNEAIIEEVDQDGGTLRSYSLDQANQDVYIPAADKITQDFLKIQGGSK